MSSTLKAEISDASVKVEYEYEGRKVDKEISLESFVKTLQTGIKSLKSMEFYPPGMRLKAKKGNLVLVGYEFQERVQDITYSVGPNRDEKFKTLFPWGITFIEFQELPDGYQWRKFYQLALKGPALFLDTMMYEWPGTNIFNDHSVCMGSNNPPRVASLEQTSGFPFLFYNGINTHDISGGNFKHFNREDNGAAVNNPYTLYKYLEPDAEGKTRAYPYDKLNNALSIKSFLEGKGYL